MDFSKFDELRTEHLHSINEVVDRSLASGGRDARRSMQDALSLLIEGAMQKEGREFLQDHLDLDHAEVYSRFCDGLYGMDGRIRPLFERSGGVVVTVGLGDVPDSADLWLHGVECHQDPSMVSSPDDLCAIYGAGFFDDGINTGGFHRYDHSDLWAYATLDDVSLLICPVSHAYWYVLHAVCLHCFSFHGGWGCNRQVQAFLGFGCREHNVYAGTLLM